MTSSVRHPAKRLLVHLLGAGLLIGSTTVAHAGVVSTADAIATDIGVARATEQARVAAFFEREDVRAMLVARGVDPTAADERVARLTDAELAALGAQIDRLPAGAGVIEVVGVVFVVLLILELVGVTDVFTAI